MRVSKQKQKENLCAGWLTALVILAGLRSSWGVNEERFRLRVRGHLQTGLTSEENLGMNEGSAIPQAGAHMGQNGNRESPLVQRPRFSASWPPKYPCSALLSPFSRDGLKPQNLNLKGDLSFLVFPGILLQRQERLASNYHPSTDSTELEVPAPPPYQGPILPATQCYFL